MGMTMGEDNQIGPGNFVLSNFRLANESADLIRQETDLGVVTYTACLADTVLSDAKGQAIDFNEQNLESKVQCFTVLQDSKTGKVLASSTPTLPIDNEDLSTTAGNKILSETDSPSHSEMLKNCNCYYCWF